MSNMARILSLDAFRGLTIVLMILVNCQDSTSYALLEHAPWNGCTLADLVFPSFLFIVGITLVVSLKKHATQENKRQLYVSIVKRSIILFALGLGLNLFPHFSFTTVRIYGVLQRIALCYLACAFIYLNTRVMTRIGIFLGILFGYWFVMTQLAVPGFGANQLTPEGSWVAYWDQLLFSSRHLLGKTFDPEGLFSTFPAIATTLLGVLVGDLLMTSPNQNKKYFWMMSVGFVCFILGWVWSYQFPINKNLWTSTFVLWTGGFSLFGFALCFLMIDILKYKRWALPFTIFGMNALFAFIVHVLLLKIQFAWIISSPAGKSNVKELITQAVFGYFSAPNAVLLYSLCFLVLNFIIVYFLYKKQIFIRI